MKNNQIQNFKETSILYGLKKCALFDGLTSDELKQIAEITNIRRYEKGDILFHAGSPAEGFYIVYSGKICVFRISDTGKEQVIHIFRSGDSFAEIILVDPPNYPADAKALELSQVLIVNRNSFRELLHRRPEISLRIITSLSKHLRVLVDTIEDISCRDVESRLIHWILRRLPDPESQNLISIEIPSSKKMLAAELGTVSETLSRTFAKFKNLGLIDIVKNSIIINSPKRLQMYLTQSKKDTELGG